MTRGFKKGDIVRISQTTWEASNARGKVGQIVNRPVRQCVNYHKNDYETLCDVRLADGRHVELDECDLDPASAIDRLGFIGATCE